MNCPNCGSARYSSNKITLPDQHLMQGVNLARVRGHNVLAYGLLAGISLGHAINAARHDHRCDHCGHCFNA